MSITAAEYATAVHAAILECEQEIAAARLEYQDKVRPIAAARKERGKAARAKRDRRIADMKAALHGEAP